MFIVIDEEGTPHYSRSIPEGVEGAAEDGLWSLIDVSLNPPEELGADGAWYELSNI